MDDPEGPRRGESVAFEPVAVRGGGPGSRSPFVLAAGAIVLGAVIAAGSLGHAGPTAPEPHAAIATPGGSAPTAGASASTAPDPLLAGNLRADDPMPLAVLVTPAAGGISIQGTVLVRSVSTVAVRIVDEGGSAIATRVISVESPDGGIRPAHQPAFALLIGLSRTALRQAYVVEIDAYDGLGTMIGSALHWLGGAAALQERCGAGRPCNSS